MKNPVETQKVVTYVRVTSKDQAKAGYSLELQREELRKYAKENNERFYCIVLLLNSTAALFFF